MQKINRVDAKKYAFDWRDKPLLRVQPGESFEIETWDASTGFLKTPEDPPSPPTAPVSTATRRCPPPPLAPVTATRLGSTSGREIRKSRARMESRVCNPK